jgi:hypothetical protein
MILHLNLTLVLYKFYQLDGQRSAVPILVATYEKFCFCENHSVERLLVSFVASFSSRALGGAWGHIRYT